MVTKVSTEEVKHKLEGDQKFYLVDVLLSKSFEGRHIPGAKNVPYGPSFLENFEKEIRVPKDADIAVYCASNGCQLSGLAADMLDKAGYSNVSHFVDGLAGWMQAGYKFETEAA